jgi:hypothetical protein
LHRYCYVKVISCVKCKVFWMFAPDVLQLEVLRVSVTLVKTAIFLVMTMYTGGAKKCIHILRDTWIVWSTLLKQ